MKLRCDEGIPLRDIYLGRGTRSQVNSQVDDMFLLNIVVTVQLKPIMNIIQQCNLITHCQTFHLKAP